MEDKSVTMRGVLEEEHRYTWDQIIYAQNIPMSSLVRHNLRDCDHSFGVA